MAPYFTIFNTIDNRWKVVDKDGFCFGDGETEKDAVLHCINTLDITVDEIDTEVEL